MSEWRERSAMLGRDVSVRSAGRDFIGTADAIDDEGALLVRTTDGVERVVAGDVVVRR
jgi:BirA family biotin operon repressor/biotin-[acetyl-CoA-carboxylase] ligase